MIMLTRPIPFGLAVLGLCLLSVTVAAASVPSEYNLGDVAREDVICPITVRAVNPEMSDAAKQKNAGQVPLVFRQVSTARDEAETDLRASVETARLTFFRAFQQALTDREPQAGDLESVAYKDAIRTATLSAPPGFPFARFAPLWIRGVSDTAIVETLLQPVRDVMVQPIADDNEWSRMAMDQPIQLIQVKSVLEAPALPDLEHAGIITTAARLSGLESARSVVASYFSPDQDGMAEFATRFIRPNTFPAPGLTELLRARRRDETVVYDSYSSGQVIVKKGQPIDRKAVAVLAAVREQQLMEGLIAKVESERVTGPTNADTKQFMIWGGAAGLVFILLLWRRDGSRVRAHPPAREPLIVEPTALALNSDVENWRTRALIAEERAERAHEAIRQGALGWMKEKLFRSIFHQRTELLSTQQMAEAEMVELERRMERLLVPLQERIKTYENRIKELEETLAAQEGHDRELIDARISRVRQQLEFERAQVGQV